MKISKVLLAGALALTGAGVAFAQQDLHAIVKSIITEVVDEEEELVGDLKSGELEEGESATIAVQINPRKSYAVYSSCDFDCYDLDMAIVDDDGEDIDSDYEDDDVPIIMVEPGESGRELTIRIDMEGCDEDVCVWAVGVYEQED